jgi:hypothetical protein
LGKVGVRKPAICLEGCYDAPINRVEVRFWHLRLLSMPLSGESTKIFAKKRFISQGHAHPNGAKLARP